MLSKRVVSILGGLTFALTSVVLGLAQDAYYQDKSGPIPLYYSTKS